MVSAVRRPRSAVSSDASLNYDTKPPLTYFPAFRENASHIPLLRAEKQFFEHGAVGEVIGVDH